MTKCSGINQASFCSEIHLKTNTTCIYVTKTRLTAHTITRFSLEVVWRLREIFVLWTLVVPLRSLCDRTVHKIKTQYDLFLENVIIKKIQAILNLLCHVALPSVNWVLLDYSTPSLDGRVRPSSHSYLGSSPSL